MSIIMKKKKKKKNVIVEIFNVQNYVQLSRAYNKVRV